MFERLRRLRRTAGMRALFRETRLAPTDLVYPLFVSEDATAPEPIASMPGQFRWPLARVREIVEPAAEAGIGGLLLFGVTRRKDEQAVAAFDPDGAVPQAVASIKAIGPELVVMTDVCVCAYTPHGHCGVLQGDEIDNDRSLELLARMAVAHARAGADVVAPSSMMDGQVAALRAGLDASGFAATPIMAYSAKFASAFYGPFREAADSAPSFGDRASYQHDYANPRHAERELLADEAEGADILMVKPGLAYLDIVRLARQVSALPIAAYNVSGEYSMVKAAAERGWLDERKIVLETLTAFRRAGADLVITYHALDAARWLNES